ncbi:MAG: Gldg family protein, partial [Planctomycetota bacterium]
MQALLTLIILAATLVPVAFAKYVFYTNPTARAVAFRNVSAYFNGVLGYLFITVFVVAASLLAFDTRFFVDNQATLDRLSGSFPILLLFLVPAVTMTAWADERKLGTDELLFTLPARDIDILVGKYTAVTFVYAVALLFSLTTALVLEGIGDPDWGPIFTTYIGYWLAGTALAGAGLLASSLTPSATVAFVIGAVLCALPVFVSAMPRELFGGVSLPREALLGFGIGERLREFTIGTLPLRGVFYFVSIAVVTLYLNYIVIRRRHWSAQASARLGLQYGLRAAALGIAAVSLNVVAAAVPLRADFSAEKAYSLTDVSREVVAAIEPDRTVLVQAYVSPDVPREYVGVRKQLIGLLTQLDGLGGSRVDVRVIDTEPFSEEAEEAEAIGIEPRTVFADRDGRQGEQDIFMGLVVESSYDQVTIPFLGPGSLVEYELTRSLGTVSKQDRLTVGVLETDAQITGGGFGGGGEWQILDELGLQYEVEAVSPDSAIDADAYDVLLAVMPSSLTEPQMANFLAYVEAGGPTLIFDDPYPFTLNPGGRITVAPTLGKPAPGGPMAQFQQQQPEAKADDGTLKTLLEKLKITWTHDAVVWEEFNPHPEIFDLVPPEYLFIKNRNAQAAAISDDSPISDGLDEILLAYAGELRDTEGADHVYTPLLVTGLGSGLIAWDELTTDSFDPFTFRPARVLDPGRPLYLDETVHTVAAHVRPKEGAEGPNVVFVADIDLVSDWFFDQRLQASSLSFDNVAFVLNAVDVLAGQEKFVPLRSRRAVPRTLTAVEARTSKFLAELREKQESIETASDEKLEQARANFAEKRAAIEADDRLSPRVKEERIRILAADEELKLRVAEENLEREARREVEKRRTSRKVSVRSFS